MNLRSSSPQAVLLLWVCLLLSGGPSRAQTPATSGPAPPQRPATLAQALATLPPGALPDGTTLLCVGADWVPPKAAAGSASGQDREVGAMLPESQTDENSITTIPTDPLGILAMRYGRSLQTFGHVQALAPPTMTVLNTDPNLANLPLANLITQSPLPFLIGTLTSDQWRTLCQTGLGMDDLSADQQGLLRSALPTPLKIAPTATAGPSLRADDLKNWTGADWQRFNEESRKAQKIRDAQTQTIPGDLLAHTARFRAFLDSEFLFDVPGQSGYSVGMSPNPPSGSKPSGFELTDVWEQRQQSGEKLSRYFKAALPNELKDGDLRWNRHELSAPVPLAGLKTVDDLVARLARVTGLELYADAGYGKQPLAVLGQVDKPQPARDVLQALALCVCGAWRQVGPTYVLSDDVEGLAVRRAKMKEVVDIWGDRLSRASESIGDHLHDLQWTQTLPFSPGDPTALPDDLRKRIAAGSGNTIALSDLPPALQAGLRARLDEYEQGTDLKASATKIQGALTPQTPVRATFNLRFVLDLPGFGPLPLDLNAYRPQRSSPPPPGPGTAVPSKPIDSIALSETRRAALCAPSTPKQARAVVDELAAMGFNTLFCDVFTNGHAYVANTALPPSDDEAGGVLAAAIDEGNQKHVAVYAVLDTLCWRRDALGAHPVALPDGVTEDRTLRGETLAQFVRRQQEQGRLRGTFERKLVESQGERVWVSPADPQVRVRLEGLVRAVAAMPGLAGLAFQDTAPPGYLRGGDTGGGLDVELGYTPGQRLAFLRARHADPLDIGSWRDTSLFLRGGDASASLDITIPTFGSPSGIPGSPWNDWRADEDQALLADLWATAHTANPTLPLWMREQRLGFTFDPWTDSKKINKADDLRSEGNALGKRMTRESILVVLGPGWPDRTEDLSGIVREFRQQFGGGKTTGLLLDLNADVPDPDPARTLSHLVPLFTIAAPPAQPVNGVQSGRGK